MGTRSSPVDNSMKETGSLMVATGCPEPTLLHGQGSPPPTIGLPTVTAQRLSGYVMRPRAAIGHSRSTRPPRMPTSVS